MGLLLNFLCNISEDGSDDDDDEGDGDYVSSQEDDGLKKVIALHVIIFFCLLVTIMLEIGIFFFGHLKQLVLDIFNSQ